MELINKTLTATNLMNKRIYFPNLRNSLNYNYNFNRPQKYYSRSNIPLYKSYSLFSKNKTNNNKFNTTFSNSLMNKSNISHRDFHNKSKEIVIKEYNTKAYNDLKNRINKGKTYINNKLEKDLEMMKLQMSCDLITQKINQIKDKVQYLHQASIIEDKDLISKSKNRKNIYKKNSHNYINLKYNINYNLNNLKDENENENYMIKRDAFNELYKLRNQKFLKNNGDINKKINITFDKINNNNFFETIKTTIKEADDINHINNINDIHNINEMNLMNKKLSYKNKVKYLLLNKENNKTQNNNDINNNYSKLRDNTNNNEIESYTDKGIKLLNNLIYSTEENHENYYNNNSNEINNNNAYYNKNIKAGNKIKENSKEKIRLFNNFIPLSV